ncbi:MAG TPA: hypothetical protein VM939_06105, partial [Gemmatimonadaceae bacterium]|nr:hypothetical protein [Gemmatimonadaceae bacterium]
MIRLNLLGRLDLTAADGSEVRAILSQPKPLAVLAYLSAASPAGYRRRDELLGLLWPETTTTRGRRSLSQVLHVLRTALGTTVIDSRGDEEVGIDPTALSCDVTDFRTALNDG